MVVTYGLLYDRKNAVLGTRIARASYGVVVTERYNPKEHFGLRWELDPWDNKKYVRGQIKWIVQNGQKITHNQPLHAKITRRVGDQELLSWAENIVSSNNPEV